MLSLASAIVVGCGPRGVGATASGVLTVDGRPAPAGVRIDFQPDGPRGSPSTGITDDKGRYELWFTPGHRGVMPGECRVMVQRPPVAGPDGPREMPEALRTLRIPSAFAGEQSPLIRTVKPGHNSIDIEIDTGSKRGKR
ncbi:MAG: hypothetical protein EBZ74_09150 [Planctomycetia bacterium]|nr:hypothetical protein [Planctomycetia bacterium]